jgi:hypothetical protein
MQKKVIVLPTALAMDTTGMLSIDLFDLSKSFSFRSVINIRMDGVRDQ